MSSKLVCDFCGKSEAEDLENNILIAGKNHVHICAPCVEDAMNMLDAGATLLQIYTGFIYEGPGLAKNINRAILKRRSAKES